MHFSIDLSIFILSCFFYTLKRSPPRRSGKKIRLPYLNKKQIRNIGDREKIENRPNKNPYQTFREKKIIPTPPSNQKFVLNPNLCPNSDPTKK